MTKKSTEERLQELLDAKDEEIDQLRQDLAKQRDEGRRDKGLIESLEGGWCVPNHDGEDIPELPLPRLEYRWYQMYENQEDWSSYRVVYQLVIKHLTERIVEIPLGVTTCRGHSGDKTPPWKSEFRPAELPYRDGAHGHHDAAHLGLPLYAVPPEGPPIRLDGDHDYDHQRSEGLRHQRKAG